jgi:TRAP-type C4-dicarboxylate transport system substrate-binding protein
MRTAIHAAGWLAAVLVLTVTGCTGTADKAGGDQKPAPTNLVMLDPLGEDAAVDAFAAEVSRRSGGSLTISVQADWHKGDVDSEIEVVGAIRQEKAPLGVVPARAWHAIGIDAFDALITPFAVDSLALQQRVLGSDLVDGMLRDATTGDIDSLGLLLGPMRRPFGIARPFLTTEDFRGARIGINSSAVAARTFDVFGAAAVPQPFQGRPLSDVDGAELQLAAVEGSRYDQAGATVSANVNLWPRPVVVAANPAALARLPERDRDVLRAAAKASLSAAVATTTSNERESLANLCRRGLIRFVTASAAQLQQLRRDAEPVYTWLQQDPSTRSRLARIDELRRQTPAPTPDTAPSCAGIASPAVPDPLGPTVLDGTWKVTTTPQDEIAAGLPDGGPENVGDWVYVVDRGRFAVTQEYGAACTWGYGTWRVNGHQLQMSFLDGGGEAPTGANNKPGELFAFTWSLYHETLTFGAVTGAVSPENFRLKPWHRTSQQPRAAELNRRCPPPAAALPA